MKTIVKLTQIAEILNGENFELNYNNFQVRNFEYIKFEIELSNKHIQTLLDLGIAFDFSTKRKSNGRNDNDFVMNAVASVSELNAIEKFSRDNRLNKISMINNHQIVQAGFPLKNMRIEEGRLAYGFKFPENKDLISHIEKLEAIRKQVRKMNNKTVKNNYTLRCQVKKLDY